LITIAKPWLDEDKKDWQLDKWRYSQQAQIYPERFMEIPIS